MICIPIYLVIIIIIIIILWIYIFNDINQIKNRINKKSKDNIESSESTKNTESKIINTYPIYNDIIYNDIQKRSFLNIRDKKVLYDNFYPPERRDYIQSYPDYYIKQNFNIPTQGYPDNYQILGIVVRDNTETVYNLFGRQTFPRSNQYEYYIENTVTNVKIPIKTHGNKEIEHNQIISIPGTNINNGTFVVKLYEYDKPRYNPFTIN